MNNPIRTLARSYKWQVIYKHSKELGFKLFDNDKDLSNIQINFLQWLEIYSSLYEDLANKEKFITEEWLDNDFLVDIYLYWRRNYKYKKENEDKEDKPKSFKIGGLTVPAKMSIRD